MAMLLATFQSRTGGEDHVVTADDYGNMSCTCIAGKHGKECWAVRKLADQQYLKEMDEAEHRFIMKERGIKLRPMSELILEQQNYGIANMRRFKERNAPS